MALRPPRYMRNLTKSLTAICPSWDPRVMAWGGALAVVIDMLPSARALYTVQDRQWCVLNVEVTTDNDLTGEMAGGPLGFDVADHWAVAHHAGRLALGLYQELLAEMPQPVGGEGAAYWEVRGFLNDALGHLRDRYG